MIDSMNQYRSNNNRSRKKVVPLPISVKKHISECPICMEPINPNSNVIITKCNHQFCSTCLLREMNNRNTCPICRCELMETIKKVDNITDDEMRDIVVENVEFMPREHLKVADKLIQLLNGSKIQELFESDINIENELKEMETNILTTMTLFGYYVASDIRRNMMNE